MVPDTLKRANLVPLSAATSEVWQDLRIKMGALQMEQRYVCDYNAQ